MDFKDPSGAARLAVVAVASYAAIDLLANALALVSPSDPDDPAVTDLVMFFDFLLLIATMVIVARWIYRTNANAHSFRLEMNITPGWSVGWFFIPFANLVKPYEGMKETWDNSHQAAGLLDEMDTPLLRLWWGLWLCTNIASAVSMRITGFDLPSQNKLLFNLIVSVVNVGLCWVLIQLIQRLTRAQRTAHHSHVFA